MHPLKLIVVTTSVTETAPCIGQISTCLDSLRPLNCEIRVVADAIPDQEEIDSLADIDADKWRKVWGLRKEYEEYLERLESIVDVVRAPSFGHLAGTVRLGLRDCADEDRVLVTQHDLRLFGHIPFDEMERFDYVLLNRDDPESPRSIAWLGMPSTDETFTELAHGAFSDQSHVVRVGWYRENVLDRCGKTCMEHVVHGSCFGNTAMLNKRCVDDLGRGSMVRDARRYVGGGRGKEEQWEIVHFDKRGVAVGACQHRDFNRPAHKVTVAAKLEESERAERSSSPSSVLALGLVDGNKLVSGYADGLLVHPSWTMQHTSSVRSLLDLGNDEVAIGDARGGVAVVSADLGKVKTRWPQRLSGWVRSMALWRNELIAVGCNEIFGVDGSIGLDSGRTSEEEEEPWRRHDILSISSHGSSLHAGLVDGSLRIWSEDRNGTTMTVVPRAHRGRVVFVGTADSDDAVISVSRDGVVRRSSDRHGTIIHSYDDKTVVCAHSSLGFVALGCKDGSVLLLDDYSLNLRTSHHCSDAFVTSLLVTSSPPQIAPPSAEQRQRSDSNSVVYVVAGCSDGSVRVLTWGYSSEDSSSSFVVGTM